MASYRYYGSVFDKDIMPPIVTSPASILTRLFVAPSVELLRMTASIASLSALDSSIRTRLWPLRLNKLHMANRA